MHVPEGSQCCLVIQEKHHVPESQSIMGLVNERYMERPYQKNSQAQIHVFPNTTVPSISFGLNQLDVL